MAAVQLSPTENVAQAAASQPEGTEFILRKGLYKQVQVRPRTGQRFNAEPGVVLDGEGKAAHAFHWADPNWNVADNVHVEGFEVRNYTARRMNDSSQIDNDEGAAVASKHAEGWSIQGLYVHHCNGVGISLGYNSRVEDNEVAYCGEQGLHGEGQKTVGPLYSEGWKEQRPGLTIVRGNHIHHNMTRAINWYVEGGAFKFSWFDGMLFEGNRSFGNYGPGAWWDIDNRNVVISNNDLVGNRGIAIFYEISSNARISCNRVSHTRADSRSLGHAIEVSESSDVEVDGNILFDNDSGISVLEGPRHWNVARVNVHHNLVIMPTARKHSQIRKSSSQLDARFTFNRYEGKNAFDTPTRRTWGAYTEPGSEYSPW